MRHIQKILDCPGSAGLKVIGAAMDFVEGRVIPLSKGRNVLCWITQTNPDPVIFLTHLIGFDTGCGRWFLCRVSGETNALSGFIIRPAVIGTHQGLTLDFSEREPCSPVHAQIAPSVDLITHTPQYKVFFKQTYSHRLICFKVGCIRDHMPIIHENRIMQHYRSFRRSHQWGLAFLYNTITYLFKEIFARRKPMALQNVLTISQSQKKVTYKGKAS